MADLALSPTSSGALYKTEFCMWNDLSYTECERLLDKANSHDDIKTMLQVMLQLDVAMETVSPLQAQITRDLYAYGVIFARKSSYSPIQLSTLVSILKRVHVACISTPFDNLDATMKMFQELMVKHSVERPPYSTCVFNIAEVKAIADYLLTTYIKHFKMYKFAFTKKVQLDLIFGPQTLDSGEEAMQEREEGESSSKVTIEESASHPEKSEENSSEEKEEQKRNNCNIEQTSEEHTMLESLIKSSVNEKLEQLQATLETHMQKQEQELLARITSLEQMATVEGKQGAKNKKNK